jgi:hypothetical protein
METPDNRASPSAPDREQVYRSPNGDAWFYERPLNGLPMVVHEANAASGGTVTRIPVADFLEFGNGPEQQALSRLLAKPSNVPLDQVKRPSE